MKRCLATIAAVILSATAPVAEADDAAQEAFRALTTVPLSDDATQADTGPEPEVTAAMLPIAVADEAALIEDMALRPGDRIAFEITGVEGARVHILNMDSAGTIRVIYPNRFAPADSPQEADILQVPAPGADYAFEVSGAPGTELVKVIALRGDSLAFDTLMAQLFDQQKAFPEAKQDATRTIGALSAFFEAASGAKLRDVTMEYTIVE